MTIAIQQIRQAFSLERNAEDVASLEKGGRAVDCSLSILSWSIFLRKYDGSSIESSLGWEL